MAALFAFAMINNSLQKTVSWVTICISRMHKACCCRQMMLTVSPVIARAIRFSAPLSNPGFLFRIHGNREVFFIMQYKGGKRVNMNTNKSCSNN